jgi:hypothetical protein
MIHVSSQAYVIHSLVTMDSQMFNCVPGFQRDWDPRGSSFFFYGSFRLSPVSQPFRNQEQEGRREAWPEWPLLAFEIH